MPRARCPPLEINRRLGLLAALLPPFLPSSDYAAEDLRGLDLPSFFALALAFLAVSLPLPFLSATVLVLSLAVN